MSKETVKVVEIDTNPAVKSIKDLRKELKDFKDQMANLEEGSDAFLEIANKAGETKHKIDEINESVKGASADFGDMVGNITNVAAGITGAFQAVAGGLQAMGVESEALDKTIAKMQGLMAVTQGLGSIDTAIKSLDKIRNSITSTTGAAKLLKAALQPKIFLAISAAITGLTLVWNKWGDAIKEVLPFLGKTSKQLEEEKKAAEEAEKAKKAQADAEETYRNRVSDAVADVLSSYKLLQAQYKRLKTDLEKTKWIEKNKEAFEKLGISVKNLKDAEDKFVNNTDSVVQALIKRAIAASKQQQLTDLAAKYTEAKVKAEQDYEKKKVAAYDEVSQRKQYSVNDGMFVSNRDGKWYWDESGAKKENEKIKKQLFAEADLYLKQMNELATDIANEMSIDNIIESIDTNVNGGNGGNGGGNKKTPEEIKAEKLAESNRLLDIRLEKLKHNGETEKKNLEETIKIETERLALYEQDSLEYERIESRIYDLKKQSADLDKEITEEGLNAELAKAQYELKGEELLKKQIEIETKRLTLLELESAEYYNQQELIRELQTQLEGFNEINGQTLDQRKEYLRSVADEYLTIEKRELNTPKEYKRVLDELAEAEKLKLINHKEYLQAKERLDDVYTQNVINQTMSVVNATSSMLTGLLDGLADQQDQNSKEGFESSKKMQIASATIQMLTGIVTAFSGAFTNKLTFADWILAGIQAATIATTGAMNINKIKNTKFDGGGSANVSAGAINNMIVPPVQFSSAVQGAQTESAIQNTKVYVSETDIVNTINKVSVQETENSY